ncbi:MAG: hypothetical protein WC954_06755 [Sphaerochaeta sp.]|jgi:hypothetical protein
MKKKELKRLVSMWKSGISVELCISAIVNINMAQLTSTAEISNSTASDVVEFIHALADDPRFRDQLGI